MSIYIINVFLNRSGSTTFVSSDAVKLESRFKVIIILSYYKMITV
jgi:hypothetical protein